MVDGETNRETSAEQRSPCDPLSRADCPAYRSDGDELVMHMSALHVHALSRDVLPVCSPPSSNSEDRRMPRLGVRDPPVDPLGDGSVSLSTAERVPRGTDSTLCDGVAGGILESGDRSDEPLSDTEEKTRLGVLPPSSGRRKGWRV
eukprot:scaffold8736_cov114-Isochrysis_galbana.AAC.8